MNKIANCMWYPLTLPLLYRPDWIQTPKRCAGGNLCIYAQNPNQ